MDYKMELIGPNEAILFDHAQETFVSMAAKMTRKEIIQVFAGAPRFYSK